jgi:IS30 family transposase
MIKLDPNGIYSPQEVAKMIKKNERTVRREARRLGKKRGAWFSASEVREVLGAR